MTVQELMERSGMEETGRALAYIKDALDEMNIISETHTRTVRIDIVSGKRFYHLPNDMLQILDIRCKNHNNGSNEYRSIPRTIEEPFTKDSDGI